MKNQKGFVNTVLIVLVIILVGVAGYFVLNNRSTTSSPTPAIANEQPTLPSVLAKPTLIDEPSAASGTPTDWQFVDANYFTLSLPPGWKFNKLQGIDSYVGEFVGDGVRLFFDFGWYSSSGEEGGDPEYVVTYETIGGYRAKIVVPKMTGSGTTGIYFADLGNKNRFSLSGSDLTSFNQETALEIFRTIKFNTK